MGTGSHALEPGVRFADRFELVRRLGQGGYGDVWAVRDGVEDCALKVFDTPLSNARLRQRVIREADALARVEHPNIVRAHGIFEATDAVGLALELVHGETLARLLFDCSQQRRVISIGVVCDVVAQICAGIQAAHDVGLVHRDLKPSNVMIETAPPRLVKVVDFGVAHDVDTSEHEATTLGRRIGSYMYMSPEQARGDPIDARSDIFAVGCLLFEMLTLRRTWARDADGAPLPCNKSLSNTANNGMAAILQRIQSAERPSAARYRPDVPPSLDAVITKALAIDRVNRFQDASALSSALLNALGARDPDAFLDDPTYVHTINALAELRLPFEDLTPVEDTAVPITEPESRSRAPFIAGALLLCAAGGLFGVQIAQTQTPDRPPARPTVSADRPAIVPTVERRPPTSTATVTLPATTIVLTPRKPQRLRKPPPPAVVEPPSTDVDALFADLRALEANPNPKAASRLSDAIGRRADRLADPVRARSIKRRAYSSALVGDIKGIRVSLEMLRAAGE